MKINLRKDEIAVVSLGLLLIVGILIVTSPVDDEVAWIELPYNLSSSDACQFYRESFPNEYTTEQENLFPLAFTIGVSEDLVVFARLLRAVYRPSNVYCVHVDANSSEFHLAAVKKIANCIDDKRIHVLEHMLERRCPRQSFACWDCVRFLVQAKNDSLFSNWRYLINMGDEEFPLKTNLEMVELLKQLKGYNLIGGEHLKPENPHYATLSFMAKSFLKMDISWMKGSVHFAASKPFLVYSVLSPVVKRILLALMSYDKSNPCLSVLDEFFWSTLNYNAWLRAPGGCGQALFKGETGKILLPMKFPRVFLEWPEVTLGVNCSGSGQTKICHGEEFAAVKHQPHLSTDGISRKFKPLVYESLEKWIIHRVLPETPLDLVTDNEFKQFKQTYLEWTRACNPSA